MFPTSSEGTYDISNTEVEKDVVVIDEDFIAVNEEETLCIKQEEIPGDINFPGMKSEPHEVSYVSICMYLDIFYQCP